MDISITFGPNADKTKVTDYSMSVLKDILTKAGISSAVISSTQRFPHDQARVMFDNCENHGVSEQKALYKEPGQAVIDVYDEGKKKGLGRDQIIANMEAKIIALGPFNVSHHVADPKVLNVFDVAPSSIPDSKKDAFIAAVQADKRVSRFFMPPKDPGFHLEIPNNG